LGYLYTLGWGILCVFWRKAESVVIINLERFDLSLARWFDDSCCTRSTLISHKFNLNDRNRFDFASRLIPCAAARCEEINIVVKLREAKQ
jgi:hypothetical protein